MDLSSLITVIFVLAVIGFVVWLVQTQLPIAAPFKQIIMFIIVVAVIIWLLGFFGIWHMPGRVGSG